MSLPISEKQQELLRAFHDFGVAHGRTPSVRELARVLQRAASSVHQLLRALERKGLMQNDGSSHGWRLTNEALADVRVTNRETAPLGDDRGQRIPIRGTIAAGQPIEAIDDPDDAVEFDVGASRGDFYALRVVGDSMIDDHILDGDIVVIRAQDRVDEGEIAVALLEDGSATLKRVYRDQVRRQIRLQPANPSMEPIYVDDVRIQGKAVGIVRSL